MPTANNIRSCCNMLPYSAQSVQAALLELLQKIARLSRFVVGTWYRQGRANWCKTHCCRLPCRGYSKGCWCGEQCTWHRQCAKKSISIQYAVPCSSQQLHNCQPCLLRCRDHCEGLQDSSHLVATSACTSRADTSQSLNMACVYAGTTMRGCGTHWIW